MRPCLSPVLRTAAFSAALSLLASSSVAQTARNVILMIADGAGPTTWEMANMFQFGPDGGTAPEFRQSYESDAFTKTWLATYAGHSQPLPYGQADIRLGLPAGSLPPLLPQLWNELKFPGFGSYDPARANDATPGPVNLFGGNPVINARGTPVALTPVATNPATVQLVANFARSQLSVFETNGFEGYDYLLWEGVTDSAAAGTALASGVKSYSSGINYDLSGNPVPFLTELVKETGRAAGVVTTKPFTDATPAAFGTRDDFRDDEAAISHDMIHNGLLDVIITPGHPEFAGAGVPRAVPSYGVISEGNFAALRAGTAGGDNPWTLVDDPELLAAIGRGEAPAPERLFGFVPSSSTLNSRDTTGRTNAFDPTIHDPENPPAGVVPFVMPELAELSLAALETLSRNERGFFAMIEGATVDSAAHANDLAYLIEEMLAFNRAVDGVIDWVETHSSWEETLLIITTDHANGMFLGPESDTIFMQSPLAQAPGELPLGMWWSTNHTSELVPMWARGPGSDLFSRYFEGVDPVRGNYLHLAGVNAVMSNVLIPEPSTAALFGFAGVGALLFARRRRA
jgi:alkaline phosphatase